MKKILLIDSDLTNRSSIQSIIEKEYSVTSSTNATEALRLLHSKKQKFDAIILDLALPNKGAFKILEHLKDDPRLSPIPVVVDSIDDSHEDEMKALTLGAWDYLARPYHPDFVLQRFSNLFSIEDQKASLKNARTDKLTGLLTKDAFYEEAGKKIISSPKLTYDIIVADIERFKLINDLYGEKAGDEVLVATARTLEAFLSMNGATLLGRIGPDSFASLAPHKETYNNACFQELNTAINKATPNINVVLDYGIYFIHHVSLPVPVMIDRAILAMSSVKGLYQVNFKIYDNAIRDTLMHEQYVVDHMERALHEGQFEVYYQPKFDLDTFKIIGVEALVRWNDPEKGLVMPGSFIPIFEKNGFVSALDRYVFQRVCEDMANWFKEGHKEFVPCSVNVSRADIFNPNIDDVFLGVIKKNGLSPQMVHLEITESAYTENSEQLISTVKRLQKLGFIIEMDDFGTGYSSLNMLTEVPIDLVKLDVRFMQSHSPNSSRSVISFIVSLSHSMGFKVIAEGVETKEQVDLLRSLDFHMAQGFFYSRPLQLKDFIKKISARIKEDEGRLGAEKILAPTEVLPDTVFLIGLSKEEASIMDDALKDSYNLDSASDLHGAIPLLREKALGVKVIIAKVGSLADLPDLKILLRSSKELSIPVLTLNDDTTTVAPSLALGTFDFIRQPFNKSLINRRVRSAIESKRIASFQPEKEVYGAFADMKKRAEEDFLTGLLNRSQFEKEVDDFFVNNHKPESLFVMIDLDNLKSINDTEGHVKGDEAIVTVAKRLKEIFPESHTIGRLGGDEFAVFVPYSLTKRSISAKIKCLVSGGKEIKTSITCSAGIAIAPINGTSFQSLYEKADTALLAAKRNGKSSFMFFSEGMETPFEIALDKVAKAFERDENDAVFACDSASGEMLYVNETMARLLSMKKDIIIGSRCFSSIWRKGDKCKRCSSIDKAGNKQYDEEITLPGGAKAMLNVMNVMVSSRKVKLHRIRLLED